jgi:hypothetical protein
MLLKTSYQSINLFASEGKTLRDEIWQYRERERFKKWIFIPHKYGVCLRLPARKPPLNGESFDSLSLFPINPERLLNQM